MGGSTTWRTIAAAGLLAGTAAVLVLPGRSAAPATHHCPVTHANGRAAAGEARGGDHHGNGKLWTTLNRDGTFTVAAESSPEYLDEQGAIAVDGVLLDDGSIGIKAPWWRGPGVRGLVRIEAERLDRDAPTVARTIPESGYGLTGFQATGLALPGTGCWRVTGSVGSARLTFVTLIAEAR